jgi:PAS domain S-box-containing protein
MPEKVRVTHRDELTSTGSVPSVSDTGLTGEAVWSVLDAAPDGIILVDEAGEILLVNRQTEELFGYGRGDLVGRSVDELLPERLRQVHRAHRTRYRVEPRTRGMGAGLTLFGRRADGQELPVEISLSPMTTDAGLRVVATVRDITERLEAERRLRQAEQDLRLVEDRERIARDLHDIVIQKLFAAGMTIQGVWSRTTEPESARRLSGIVDDLDETIREIRSVIFSLQAETGQERMRGEILRVVSEERLVLGFEPRVRFDGRVETMSDAVAAELLPTLREALSNVARHAEASAVEIFVECDESVALRVLDDGRGIPATVTGGSGIRNLTERAEMLGGSCRVVARPDGGTMLEWHVPNTL